MAISPYIIRQGRFLYLFLNKTDKKMYSIKYNGSNYTTFVGDWIYFTTYSKRQTCMLNRINLDGTNQKELFPLNSFYSYSSDITNDRIVYLSESDNNIYKFDFNTMTSSKLSNININSQEIYKNIEFYNNWIYLIDSQGKWHRLSIDGKEDLVLTE